MFKSGNGGSVDGIPALGADLALISGPTGMITTSVTTSLELSYLSGVTSSVQTQLNGKQPTGNYITALTGDVTAAGPGSVAATIGALKVTNGMLAGSIAQNKMSAVTASRALESDASGFYAVSVTTSAELGYLSGVTSSVQTQINSKMTNPMTTGGDVIYGGASGVPTRLANGTAGQFFKSNGATVAPSWQSFTKPTVQAFLTAGSFTHTTPAGCTYLFVQIIGAGGGGGGGGSGATTATNGGNSLFVSLQGTGGTAGNTSGAGGAGGGVISNATLTRTIYSSGASGGGTPGNFLTLACGGMSGAAGAFGGGGKSSYNAAGGAAAVNSGAGGGGGGSSGAGTNSFGGPGGGAGGYLEGYILSPSATHAITVGAGGAGGAAAANGYAGGAGGDGAVIVTEFYN